MKKGYKVVYNNISIGKLTSAVVGGTGMCIYELNEITKRLEFCGPLAVFKNLKSAKKFRLFANHKIFKCDYKPSIELSLYILHTNRVEKISKEYLPFGTDFADEVILRKEVC